MYLALFLRVTRLALPHQGVAGAYQSPGCGCKARSLAFSFIYPFHIVPDVGALFVQGGGSKNLTAYLIVANCGFRKLVLTSSMW